MGELDLFGTTMYQTQLMDEYDHEYAPTAAITKGAPIEFLVKSAGEFYTDLNSTKLKIKCKINQADMSKMANADLCGTANLTLHSIFQEIVVTINGKPVSDPINLYPYRAFLSTLLNYDKSALETRLQTEGWEMDDAVENVKLDGDDAKNDGLKVRAKTHKESKVVTFIGRPHVDIFHLGKLLPP